MEPKSIEIGRRLKRFRNALGWTQEQLAEKANTSPQNISKYEKMGLADINTIEQLSTILGQDLQSDEKDAEGSVGEIGMEILMTLIRRQGDACPENLGNYGLSDSDITHELFKLQKLGLIVHDKYKDFDGNEKDIVFITAKGIITCKNTIKNDLLLKEITDCLPDAKSIEQRFIRPHDIDIGDVYSMSEYIDKRRNAVEIVRDLPVTKYRTNYIRWLKKEFLQYDECCGTMKWECDNRNNNEWWTCEPIEKIIFPAINFYVDIIHSMIAGITDENIEDIIKMYVDPWYQKEYSMSDLGAIKEIKKHNLNIHAFPWAPYKLDRLYPWVQTERLEKSKIEDEKDVLEEYKLESLGYQVYGPLDRNPEEMEKKINEFYTYLENRYNTIRKGRDTYLPSQLISNDEAFDYIKKRLRKPQNKYEQEIEDKIKELNTIYPETEEYYSNLPTEWENKGIADYVRAFYGVKNTESRS